MCPLLVTARGHRCKATSTGGSRLFARCLSTGTHLSSIVTISSTSAADAGRVFMQNSRQNNNPFKLTSATPPAARANSYTCCASGSWSCTHVSMSCTSCTHTSEAEPAGARRDTNQNAGNLDGVVVRASSSDTSTLCCPAHFVVQPQGAMRVLELQMRQACEVRQAAGCTGVWSSPGAGPGSSKQGSRRQGR